MLMFYILNIIAAFLAGITPTIQASAQTESFSATSVVLLTDIFLIFFSFLGCLIERKTFKIKSSNIILYILAGVFLFGTDLFLNTAYSKVPVGLVTMIHFLYPTFVCLGNILFFKEKGTIYKFLSIILSVSGLFFIYGSERIDNIYGFFIALASGVCYCSYLIIVDKIANIEKDDFSPSKVYFYAVIVETIFSIFANIKTVGSFSFNYEQLIYCGISALCLCSVGIMLGKCISKIGSSTSSLLSTFEPLTSVLISAIIFNYIMDWRSIIGSVLVILSLFPPIIEGIKSKRCHNE